MGEELILKGEVYRVVGAAIEVYNNLGPGFLEAVYQEAMELELTERGIPYCAKKPLQIRYKRWVLSKTYEPDIECFGSLVVELKAIDSLTTVDEAQLLNYLRATLHEVGLLLNFGASQRLQWKRMVRSRERYGPQEFDEAGNSSRQTIPAKVITAGPT